MDPAHLRISDNDRDRVATVLRTAQAEGRLTADELDERVRQLPGLRTYAHLDELVADLPVPVPSQEVTKAGAPMGPGHQGPAADQPLRIDAGLSSDGRSGVWTIPRVIELYGTMGSIKMDCLEAVCPHPEVFIRVSGGAGTIVVIVPEGWAARVHEVRKSWGTVRNKVPEMAHPGCPLLVFEGAMGMGTLVIRHANWWDRWRQSRRQRKQRKLELESGWTETNPELDNPTTLR